MDTGTSVIASTAEAPKTWEDLIEWLLAIYLCNHQFAVEAALFICSAADCMHNLMLLHFNH